MSSQQPSIIWVVTYLNPGDAIKLGTNSRPLYQNDSRNSAKGLGICPGVQGHGEANILWSHGRDVLMCQPCQNLPANLEALEDLPQVGK